MRVFSKCNALLILLVMIEILVLSKRMSYLFDNIFVRFDPKQQRQIVEIPMGTNCTPLVADLFCFVFFMKEISRCLFLMIDKQILLKLLH